MKNLYIELEIYNREIEAKLLLALEAVSQGYNVIIANRLMIQKLALNNEIPQLIKYKFQTMFLQDKLSNQIKNFDNWITEFIKLDRIRGANNSGK